MAARLEIEIGGTDKGGNSELKETLGLIEQLKQVQAGLNFELFKAETVQEIREVGERLTGVNTRLGEYLKLASKATQAWRDNQTEVILDNLATKLSVLQANSSVFGQSIQVQNNALRAYQQAFDALVKNGVDPADASLTGIKSKIDELTGAIEKNKNILARQKIYDDLSTKLKQISTDTRLMGDAQKTAEASIRANQAAITALIKTGVDPADHRIKDLQKTISQLSETAQKAGLDKFRNDIKGATGIVAGLEARAQYLRDAIRRAMTVPEIESLQRRLSTVTGELNRLGVSADRFSSGAGGASGAASAFGTEIARIVQDAPYATKALGAIQNNFGAIGNNITWATELWGGYVNAARASVIANGQVATSSAVAREAIKALTTGMTPYLLAISLVTSAIQVWTALSQRRQRELEKEKQKVKTLAEQTEQYISTMDALTKLTAQSITNYSKEIATLETLNRTVNSSTAARSQQQQALEELQRLYPDVFSNMTIEEVQAGKNAEAYNKLAESIRAVAYAEAARSLGAKAMEDQLKATVALAKTNEELSKSEQELIRRREELTRKYGLDKDKDKEEILNFQTKALQENIAAQREQVRILGEAAASANREAEAYFNAAEMANGKDRERIGLLNNLQDKLESLQRIRPTLGTEEALRENKKAIEEVLKEIDRLEGKTPLAKVAKGAKQATLTVNTLGESISKIYNPATDSDNLIGLEALEKANQATLNKYQGYRDKINEVERQKTEFYKNELKKKPKLAESINAELLKVEQEAAKERAEVDAGEQRALEANKLAFAKETADKIAELDARAGIDRIKSREQEIAADKVYWDAVERNAEKYGITATQLTEWRKKSEAGINEKWDAKMVQDSFLYQRRQNEGMSQMLLRRLNEETEAKVKAAKGDAAKLLEIERDYQEKLGALQERNRQVKITQSFDGTFTSEPIAKINAELDLLRQKLDQGTISAEAFRLKVSSLETERATLQAFQGTVDSITGSFSNLAGEIFTNTENALENLGKTFQNVTKSIISDLVKIAIRQAINASLSKSVAAGEVATAQATGRAIASAYSSGATLASIATYGTAAAVGAGAVLAALAVTKGSAVAGFAKGGYTGNGGTGRIAGVVHGREFVVNAKATKDYLPLLRAINAGTDISRMFKGTGALVGAHSTATSDVSSRVDVVVHGEISGDVIKLVTDKANRDFNRYFGRS